MTISELILYDRSGVTLDWKCPRAHFWNRIFAGRGISPTGVDEDLLLGIILHDAIAQTLTSGGSPAVLDAQAVAGGQRILLAMQGHPPVRAEVPDLERYALERAALCEGFIRGWWRYLWPRLQLQYKVEAVESEQFFIREGTKMQTKPDFLLTEMASELLGYMEWKTTAINSAGWFDAWNYAAQLHSGGAAVKQTSGKTVDFALVQGLYKGVYQDGWQHSPFCYCWVSEAQKKDFDQPFTDMIYDEANNLLLSPIYRRGARWSRVPTWEMPHGLAWWVEQMPAEILQRQFPTTPPIFLNEEVATEFFDQTIPRVLEIDRARKAFAEISKDFNEGIISLNEANEASEAILRKRFPKHTDQCSPAIGRRCAYWRCCHSPIGSDPIGSGYYEKRTPHHAAERAQFGLPEKE